MPGKRIDDAILTRYSLEELIELAKEKAQMDIQEQLDVARNHIAAFSQAMTGHSASPAAGSIKGRRGSHKTSQKVKKAAASRPPIHNEGIEKTSRERASNKIPLGAHLAEILGDEPMNIETIMCSLDSRGYVSKSKDPRRVLYLELKKQIDKGVVRKSSRGMYEKA